MTEVPQKKPHIPIHQERAPSSAVSNAGQSCGSTDAMLTLGEGAFSGGAAGNETCGWCGQPGSFKQLEK